MYVSLLKRAANETRTRDPDLGKVVLYQLSYCRILRLSFSKELDKKSGRQDSNLRPPGPKPDALPSCATPRCIFIMINSFPNCECKGTIYIWYLQTFLCFFFNKNQHLYYVIRTKKSHNNSKVIDKQATIKMDNPKEQILKTLLFFCRKFTKGSISYHKFTFGLKYLAS